MKTITDSLTLRTVFARYLSNTNKTGKPLIIWFGREAGLSNMLLDKFKLDTIKPDETILLENLNGSVNPGDASTVVFHRYVDQMNESFLKEVVASFDKYNKPLVILANGYEFNNRPEWIDAAFEQIWFAPMLTIALVSCAKKKFQSPNRVHASELYISTLFIKAWAFTERQDYDNRYILSDKYGLLKEDTLVHSYDETLNSKSPQEKAAWAKDVLESLIHLGYDLSNDCFVFLTGKVYRRLLIGEGKITNPCELYADNNLRGIGEILHFLSK